MDSITPVDACDFTVFGGTGDLALRKLLPALYLRDRDGQLPDGFRVIGVSRAEVDDDGYRALVAEALREHVVGRRPRRPDVVERLLARLHHVTLDVADVAAWHQLHDRLKDGAASDDVIRVFYLAVAPGLFGTDLRAPRRGRPGRPSAPASCWRSRSAPTSPPPSRSTRRSAACSRSRASSASTTTSARRASRTSWSPASPTRSSSRCGTAAGSTTCRSPCPSRSASATAAPTTTAPARCATWCRTTCCSSCASWPWSRRPTSTARPCATRSSRCSRPCAR